MNPMSPKSSLFFLDPPIAFHRSFVSFGGVTGALLLSQMIYLSKMASDQSGWLCRTQEEWEMETGLTRRELDLARSRLRAVSVLLEQKKGMPAKIWYKIDFEKIVELVQAYLPEGASHG